MKAPPRHNARTRGSVLITAIIVTAILSIGLGSMIEYTSHINTSAQRDIAREIAFHLAESGLELGINDLQNGLVTSNFWSREALSYPIGTHTGSLNIAIIQDSADSSSYTIHSLAKLTFASGEIKRAVSLHIKATQTTQAGGANEDNENSGGIYPYAIATTDGIAIQISRNRSKFASYNSNHTFDPIFGFDTGYAATLVTQNNSNNAISVNNAVIHGTLNSGGGAIDYRDSKLNSSRNPNLWLSTSSEDSPKSINYDGIQNSFNGTINAPTYPTTSGYKTPTGQSEVSAESFWSASSNTISYGVSQNFWQSGADADSSRFISAQGNSLTIGAPNNQTVLTTPSITLQNNSTLNIEGDVVLYVHGNFNILGDIHFAEGATLHLIAQSNNHFTGSTDNPRPIQFQVTPYIDLTAEDPRGPNVVFSNTGRVAMVINAPYSSVNTSNRQCGANANYLGSIVARSYNCANGINFFYDTSLATAGSEDDTADDFLDEVTEPEYQVLAWSENPTRTVETTLTEWGLAL